MLFTYRVAKSCLQLASIASLCNTHLQSALPHPVLYHNNDVHKVIFHGFYVNRQQTLANILIRTGINCAQNLPTDTIHNTGYNRSM